MRLSAAVFRGGAGGGRMRAQTKGSALTSISPTRETTKATSGVHHTPGLGLFNDRELSGFGLVRARDGRLLDDRDDFYSAYPEDYIRTFDSRTHVAVSRGLISKLLSALVAA